MNILWLSVAPWLGTGYATQTAQAVTRLRDAGHNVAVSSQHGLVGTSFDWDGIRIYPNDYTGLNKRLLRHQVADWAERCGCGADEVQVITLYDIWPWVDPSPAYGSIMADFKGLQIASWLPLDAYPIPPKTAAALEMFGVRPIAMSRFGETLLKDSGLDPLYVPHAIDTAVLRPHEDREDCKRMIHVDPDAFVVGMVAHNAGLQPSRKAFPNVLQAFAAFRKEHDDAVLYLHTEVTGTAYNGLNLVGMAEMFGIPDGALACVPQIAYLAGEINEFAMGRVYSAFDVLASPSYGEGFGLPIVEAQSCGTPVIVSEYTAMPELVGAGWSVGGQPWYNESSGAWWLHPDTEQIYTALEKAYEARGDMELRAQAREFACGYDADLVFAEHWVPALDVLDRPREVPPLRPLGLNRAERRAQAKVAA